MKILVKKQWNEQAVPVKVLRFKKKINGREVLYFDEPSWSLRLRKEQELNYSNDLFNGKTITQPSEEALAGARGDY